MAATVSMSICPKSPALRNSAIAAISSMTLWQTLGEQTTRQSCGLVESAKVSSILPRMERKREASGVSSQFLSMRSLQSASQGCRQPQHRCLRREGSSSRGGPQRFIHQTLLDSRIQMQTATANYQLKSRKYLISQVQTVLLRQSFQVRYLLEAQRDDLALPAFPQSSGRQVALLLVVLGVGPGEFALHDVQGIFIDADPSFEGGETHLVRDDIELPIFYLQPLFLLLLSSKSDALHEKLVAEFFLFQNCSLAQQPPVEVQVADGSSPFLDPRTFVSALGVRLPGKVAVSAAGEGHGGNLIFGLGRRFVKCLVFAVNVLQFDLDLYSVLFPGLQEVIRMASLMQPGMIASESLRKAVVQLVVHR